MRTSLNLRWTEVIEVWQSILIPPLDRQITYAAV